MDSQILTTFYYLNVGLVFLVIVLMLTAGRIINNIFWIIALSGSATSFVLLTHASGHLPVSGDFEKFQALAFLLLALGVLRNVIFKGFMPGNILLPSFTLLILAAALFVRREVSSNYLIYERWDVMLFFYFRKTAIALFIMAVSEYLNALIFTKDRAASISLRNLGRNLTMLGGTFFIAGELAGSLWALHGWGDPWRWSRGFFIAGVMFLLSMLALHIPSKWTKSYRIESFLAAAPIAVIILLYII